MNYFSTKEFSNLWGISTQRITHLCAQGRIDGAVLRGRQWLIPENAVKPADRRTKAARAGEKEEKILFPFILATVHSPEQVNAFSEEEKALLHADSLYEAGELEECERELKKLLTADNRYIRLGALYLLPFVYLYQLDLERMTEYAVMFKTAYYEFPSPPAALSFLLDSFHAEISNFQSISKIFDPNRAFDYADDVIPNLAVSHAAAEIVRAGTEGGTLNIFSHEIICAKIEREGYCYCATLLHSYLSMMYSMEQHEENAHRHLKRAIEIAVAHNACFTLAQTMTFFPDVGLTILKDYPATVTEKFRQCASRYVKARAALSEYCGNTPIISRLHQEDYVLLSYCLKEYSVEKMTALMSLSPSGVKKRLTSLYGKLGVMSKNELAKKYITLILNGDSASE